MKKMNVMMIAKSAIIAATYVVLTWLLAPISYGAIQFRISEILVLLVVLNPRYAYALVIGCLVANTTSSLGWYDMVFGTLATLVAILPMLKIKRLEIASIFPVVSNAFIVAFELYLCFGEPHLFWYNVGTIALGEAVVLYFVGIPVMMSLSKNPKMIELLEIKVQDQYSSFWNKERCIGSVIGVLGIILYFAYPVVKVEEGTLSMFALTGDYLWLMSFGIISLLIWIVGFSLKGFAKLFCSSLLWIGLFTCYILMGMNVSGASSYGYYYGYSIYLILYLILMIVIYLNERKELKTNEACECE